MARKPNIKKIAVFTSGGDAPGMNAAIRAVTRTGIYYGLEVMGILRGFEGMVDGNFVQLHANSVSNIIQRGGTILKSARSERFKTKEGRKKAFEHITAHKVDAIVAIGGDGTFRGALEFSTEYDISCIGIPGTIDNDLFGTDSTIGYDTAINTAIDAIDKIRDTANSHDRLFFIEVMGRDAGFIALRCGIAGGAEAILVPEKKTDIDDLIAVLEKGWRKNKTSSIVVVAEGDETGGAIEIAKKVKAKFDNYDTRVTILGHLQRGGNPTTMDRVLASTLGVNAVEALLDGKTGVMIGIVNKELCFTPFEKASKHHGEMDKNLLRISKLLAS